MPRASFVLDTEMFNRKKLLKIRSEYSNDNLKTSNAIYWNLAPLLCMYSDLLSKYEGQTIPQFELDNFHAQVAYGRCEMNKVRPPAIEPLCLTLHSVSHSCPR